MRSTRIPLSQPSPPKLSNALAGLRAIEESNLFSNFGPVNTRFEQTMACAMFGGVGECLTVCNATTGLILAIREAIKVPSAAGCRYALMPSFTFAAAAQAALWNGLTPLFCDINPADWSADPSAELQLLDRYRDEIAVIVPYATFGYDIDLAWYETLQQAYGIPVVVDAAASLGTLSTDGQGFGTGFSGAVVYSMHATKSFSTGEGGLIYSGDAARIRRLRTMSNFGFGEPRNATTMGLNGKMSEIAALLACLRFESLHEVMERRSRLVALYRASLPELTFQAAKNNRQAHQFTSALLPAHLAAGRAGIQGAMQRAGVDSANYFSPHVAQQDLFAAGAAMASLPVTDDIASRVITLPLFDSMSEGQVHEVCAAVKSSLALTERRLAKLAASKAASKRATNKGQLPVASPATLHFGGLGAV
ncbi:MAG: DegT/DnrJ/EryC1/StrS family aminotransferase [Janthinobacterium lividum]